MRTLRIHRKKKFAGALISYWVITKISKTHFIEMLQSMDEETDNDDEVGCVYIDLIEDRFWKRVWMFFNMKSIQKVDLKCRLIPVLIKWRNS